MSKPLLSHSTTGKFKFPPKYLRIPRVHVEPYPPHRVRMRCDDDLGCVGFRLTRKGACAGAPHRQPRAAPFHRAQLHEGREGHVKVLGRGQEVAGRDTAPPLLQPPAPHRALPARAGEASHVQVNMWLIRPVYVLSVRNVRQMRTSRAFYFTCFTLLHFNIFVTLIIIECKRVYSY